jgi:hypothetical protein
MVSLSRLIVLVHFDGFFFLNGSQNQRNWGISNATARRENPMVLLTPDIEKGFNFGSAHNNEARRLSRGRKQGAS